LQGVLGIHVDSHRSMFGPDEIGFRQHLEDLVKKHLYIHMGWHMGTSRWSIDAALVGVPAVVSNKLPHVFLYPYTNIDPFNISKGARLGHRIIVDADFRELVVSTARKRAKKYHSIGRVRKMIQHQMRKAGLLQ